MNIENIFRNIDYEISSILGRALDGMEISPPDALKLFEATGTNLSVITLVADELRRRANGEIVTYVITEISTLQMSA